METELTGRFVSTRAHQAIELDRVGVVNATHAAGRVIDSTRSRLHDLLASLRS